MKFRWPKLIFDETADAQMNRLQHEQDLASLKKTHRDELDEIYADLLKVRRELTEQPA